MTFNIKHKSNDGILFSCELPEEIANLPRSKKLGWAVLEAMKRGADLTGADLTGADLTGACLTGACLTGADLRDADLPGRAPCIKMNTEEAEKQLKEIKSFDLSRWLEPFDWLKDIGVEGVEIITPWVDQHNDHIRLFAKREEDDQVLLTDGGETLIELQMQGLWLGTSQEQAKLNAICRGFGLNALNDVLQIKTHEVTFPIAMNNLSQAIVTLNSLIYFKY